MSQAGVFFTDLVGHTHLGGATCGCFHYVVSIVQLRHDVNCVGAMYSDLESARPRHGWPL
jgi:hypothetical protein